MLGVCSRISKQVNLPIWVVAATKSTMRGLAPISTVIASSALGVTQRLNDLLQGHLQFCHFGYTV